MRAFCAAQPNPTRTVLLQTPNRAPYVMATIDGLFEHSVDLGANVAAGDLAGQIWPMDDLARPSCRNPVRGRRHRARPADDAHGRSRRLCLSRRRADERRRFPERNLMAANCRGQAFADHRNARRQQVVRPVSRSERHRLVGPQGRAGRRVRAIGVGQVDADPLHQPAGAARRRRHRRRRHRAQRGHQERGRHSPRSRHGVPAVQPVSASVRAGELRAAADPRPRHASRAKPKRRPWST